MNFIETQLLAHDEIKTGCSGISDRKSEMSARKCESNFLAETLAPEDSRVANSGNHRDRGHGGHSRATVNLTLILIIHAEHVVPRSERRRANETRFVDVTRHVARG